METMMGGAFRDGTIRAPVGGPEGARREEVPDNGPPGTEGRKIVVSKTHSLRWLEDLKQSQRLTAREERRKEEILELFRELYDISTRQPEPPVFPPWRPSW
jgi:hypothetical protein